MERRKREESYDPPPTIDPEAMHQTTTMQQRSDARTVELRLDTAALLDEIQNTLEGKFYDIDADTWSRPDGSEPLIRTKQGILNTVRDIKIFLNTNAILSEFTDDEIDRIMVSFCNYLRKHLKANAEDYCDNNPDTLASIHELVKNTVYATLKRARNRGESRAISDTSSITERVELGQAKGGFMPRIFR